VIVNDLDVDCVAVAEPEADPPTVVDSDAPLAGTVASKHLEPITGWDAEILDTPGAVQHRQLSHRSFLDPAEAPDPLPREQCRRVFATEGPNHRPMLSRHDSIDKR